jgi:hypothetical protein
VSLEHLAERVRVEEANLLTPVGAAALIDLASDQLFVGRFQQRSQALPPAAQLPDLAL